jgi:hypothetical protein
MTFSRIIENLKNNAIRREELNYEVLEARLQSLEHQIKDQQETIKAQALKLRELDDIESINKLQRKYNYYVQHMLKDAIIDCFADSPEVTLKWLEGVWKGKEGVRRYFHQEPGQYPPPEFLHQVMPIGGVVTVNPDGMRAKGRWFAFGGVNIARGGKSNQSFVSGTYEFEYIKENGVWKMLSVDWIIYYNVRIPEGAWTGPESLGKAVSDPNYKAPQADIPFDPNDPRFKSGYIFPFHFTHPVTGKPTTEGIRNAALLGKK